MSIAFECDRCKKVSTSMDSRYTFNTKDMLGSLMFISNIETLVDLCDSCKQDLIDVLNKFWNGSLPA